MTAGAQTTEMVFTRPEKVFFPDGGLTKGEMIRYYLGVAGRMLPHLRDRPVTLLRFPDGVDGGRFYEKNLPKFAPTWVRNFPVPRHHEEGAIRYILIDDARTLAWCANLAAIEFHPFLHRVPNLDRPTAVVFDLDPGEGADLAGCASVAALIRDLLESLGLQSFAKVTGSKGLQIYVPLNSVVNYGATGAFARAVAELLEQKHPDRIVSILAKARRRGRVLIDWSQNSASKTTVAVYSMRGKFRDPRVSMPVTWDELARCAKSGKSGPLVFSPDAALKRLAKLGDLFAPVLTVRQALPRAFVSAASVCLKVYREKRDFSKTREPRPAVSRRAPRRGQARFVVQKHAASHLHYDFRLEMDGTLKSWAVPKGLPTALGVKRSAFAVEDHPLGYLQFEGTIPKGQYGGGTVMVWDIGTYELLSGSPGEGSLKFVLHGKKLSGEWHMFKIRSERGKDVWLIAKSGEAAKAIGRRAEDVSALSGRSLARIARDNSAQWNGTREGPLTSARARGRPRARACRS